MIKDATKFSHKALREFIDDEDLPKAETKELYDAIIEAKETGDYNELSKLLNEVSDLGRAFGTEAVQDEEIDDRYWGDTRGIYINVGDQYAGTIVYDQVDDDIFITDYTTYVEYVENQPPFIWQIPVTVWDENEAYVTVKAWVKADTLDEALEELSNEVDNGNEELWGHDDRFDLGSVETTESSSTPIKHQLWTMSGVDDDDYTDEEREEGADLITASLRIFPDEAEQVDRSQVRHDERYFEA